MTESFNEAGEKRELKLWELWFLYKSENFSLVFIRTRKMPTRAGSAEFKYSCIWVSKNDSVQQTAQKVVVGWKRESLSRNSFHQGSGPHYKLKNLRVMFRTALTWKLRAVSSGWGTAATWQPSTSKACWWLWTHDCPGDISRSQSNPRRTQLGVQQASDSGQLTLPPKWALGSQQTQKHHCSPSRHRPKWAQYKQSCCLLLPQPHP